MIIDGRKIGAPECPYFIAEMSNNHNGNLTTAKRIIETAKECGADAVKLQTYTADSITINCDREEFVIKSDVWAGRSYYELYRSISMPLEWHHELFQFAKNIGITIFSSPFDRESVQLLESLDCPAYKVASFEAFDPILLKAIAETKKPIIISTGVSTTNDILETIEFLQKNGSGEYAFLHCVSSYPAAVTEMNINALDELKKYSNVFGLSDHSLGNIAISAAVAKGASIVEKHFTLDRGDGGADASFSIEPHELAEAVETACSVWESLGNSDILNLTRKGVNHARSIFVIKDVEKGETFSEKNIRIIRPGLGLHPQNYFSILGKKATVSLSRGTPLSEEHIC